MSVRRPHREGDMTPVDSHLCPEDRARLARKGEILYAKSCGVGQGTCAESFAIHQLRLGNVEVVHDLLRFLVSQLDTSSPDVSRLVRTATLIARIRRHLEDGP
jgi:hypothetical protein